MEGDSVTLHTDLPEIQRDDVLEWRFRAEGFRIAQINRGANTSNIYDDVPDVSFRDRLKLDNQTGDLTITNIRTEDAGRYEATSTKYTLNKVFIVTVSANPVSVLVGDSVTLHTGVPEPQRYDVIQWRFGHLNSPIAEIHRKTRNYFTSKTDGRFRDRLKLDYWSGSLTITNTENKHSGVYEVEISVSRHTIHKSFNVTVIGEMRTVSVVKGFSVSLQAGLTEIQTGDFITWMFGDIVLAEMYKNQSSVGQLFYTYDGAEERFRDRLKLNNQTGSLTITQCQTSNSGLYELKINRHAKYLRFTVTVSVSGLSSGEIVGIFALLFVVVTAVGTAVYHCRKNSKLKHPVKSVSVMVGDSVTLNTDTELLTDDQIMLIFGDENSPIAEIKRGDIFTYNVIDERFSDRLQLDHQTGSLTIMNIRNTDSGEYTLKTRSGNNTLKRFSVSVFDEIKSVSVIEGEPVTLNTDVELQTNDEILWMFGDKDIGHLAKTKGGTRGTTTSHGPDGQFGDSLKLDHQTGSLTITDIADAYSGEYKLQIIRSRKKSFKLFKVSVSGPTALGSISEKSRLLPSKNQEQLNLTVLSPPISSASAKKLLLSTPTVF
ncbi:uncharacterized protein LOC120493264 isoform X2 [Pimephales promelas]|nr:uncharacterized protein LOC120493264 isoform X2 [Pimephales promelas]KAG1924849.1 hypothetical protein F2P79_025894 [Pimephales promelas]